MASEAEAPPTARFVERPTGLSPATTITTATNEEHVITDALGQRAAHEDFQEGAGDSKAEQSKVDLVDDFFLNSEKPTIALFAISICLVGVMDLLPQQRHDPEIWKDKLESVSGFYGPGAVISWCITGISMLFDANQASNTGNFQYLKYSGLFLSGTFTVGDAVKRALQSDFGPSYAAALYMSDKAFELATLLYAVYHFPVHREGRGGREPRQNDDEAGPSSYRAKAVAVIERYKIWPCVAMLSIWVWSRALGNQHPVYNIHAQNPKGVNIGWDPVLLSPYWKLAVPLLCFSITSLLSILTGWGLWPWGIPMGILSSFGTLHSGFFGTFTPLKLTTCNMLDLDQITTLVTTIVALIIQYTTYIPAVNNMWIRLWHFLDLLGVRRKENGADASKAHTESELQVYPVHSH